MGSSRWEYGGVQLGGQVLESIQATGDCLGGYSGWLGSPSMRRLSGGRRRSANTRDTILPRVRMQPQLESDKINIVPQSSDARALRESHAPPRNATKPLPVRRRSPRHNSTGRDLSSD